MGLGEDGVSWILSVAAVNWPVIAVVLASVVLVVVSLPWRRWRAFRSRRLGGLG